jgi:hypothetical protein
MATINLPVTKTDKPARRNRLICCVAVGKSKRYSSNLVDLGGCHFDPLEDGAVVRVLLGQSQNLPCPSFSKGAIYGEVVQYKGYRRQDDFNGFDFLLIRGGCEHAETRFGLLRRCRASVRDAGLPADDRVTGRATPVYLIISNLPRINRAFPVARRAHGKGRIRPIRTVYARRPDELPECIEYQRSARRSRHRPSWSIDRHSL